ncbi:MAG: hypothetical protein AAF489_12200 [Bacteroidota bacterium]
MKKLLLILLLSSFYTHAQYFQAKLLMADGEIKEGLAKLPSNQLLDGNIEFKSSNKGQLQKLSHESVSQILYTSKTGSQFLFENNKVVHLFKSFGKEHKKSKKNKHWMLLIHSNTVLKEYSLAQRYKLDKKGRMTSITGSNSFWYTIYFLLKKPNENEASIVSGKGFTNGMVRKAMAIYFKDNPEFVERIENKEFKKSNVKDVADAYAKYYD